MHLLLTDRLTCPRCGPDFGLILLADGVEERRVSHGRLGCANCREEYPVEAGFADLRPPPRGPLPQEETRPGAEPDPDYWESLRLAALLGVEKGPGFAFLHGSAAAAASRIAGMVEDLEVVAAGPGAHAWEEAAGVSRMAASVPLPFYTGTLRGAILTSLTEEPEGLLEEAVRCVAPGARVVVLQAPEGTRRSLEEAGCQVLLEEEGVVVAAAGRA